MRHMLIWCVVVLLAFLGLLRLESKLSAHNLANPFGVKADCTKAFVLRKSGGQSGVGHHAVDIAIQNTCKSNVILKGYPQIKFFDGSGRQATIFTVVPSEQTFFVKGDPNKEVELKPGQEAYFQLEFSSAVAGQACVPISKIEVELPGYTDSYPLELDMRPCGETVKVSPIRSTEGAD